MRALDLTRLRVGSPRLAFSPSGGSPAAGFIFDSVGGDEGSWGPRSFALCLNPSTIRPNLNPRQVRGRLRSVFSALVSLGFVRLLVGLFRLLVGLFWLLVGLFWFLVGHFWFLVGLFRLLVPLLVLSRALLVLSRALSVVSRALLVLSRALLVLSRALLIQGLFRSVFSALVSLGFCLIIRFSLDSVS